jgi:hypothetical protein
MKLAQENFPEILPHTEQGMPGCDNVLVGRSNLSEYPVASISCYKRVPTFYTKTTGSYTSTELHSASPQKAIITPFAA